MLPIVQQTTMISFLALIYLGCTTSDTGIPAPNSTSGSEQLLFAFPVENKESAIDWLVGVDHDPIDYEKGAEAAICKNYRGLAFPDCYDGHRGSDFVLVGEFDAMDAGSEQVIAAAAGVVVEAHDGEYDRCHIEGSSVSCDGFPMVANYVAIDHGQGVVTRYLHLKKDSVLVTVGQKVTCGEPLGLIGSSGNSSFPHLHFELRVDDIVVDPFAGKYSQERSWWHEQQPTDQIWPSSLCQ